MEPRDPERVNHAVGCAGQHYVGVTSPNHFQSFTDRHTSRTHKLLCEFALSWMSSNAAIQLGGWWPPAPRPAAPTSHSASR